MELSSGTTGVIACLYPLTDFTRFCYQDSETLFKFQMMTLDSQKENFYNRNFRFRTSLGFWAVTLRTRNSVHPGQRFQAALQLTFRYSIWCIHWRVYFLEMIIKYITENSYWLATPKTWRNSDHLRLSSQILKTIGLPLLEL